MSVDLAAVSAWMDAQGLDGGPVKDAVPLAGGTQNILVRFSRGGREYVLRRGPRHLREKSNDALRKEMRVLAALAGRGVPHPRLIAACPDERVLDGAVFYLMEAVPGFNAVDGPLPALHAGDEAVRRAMGFAAVDALARLAGVDHVAAGLADVGRPEGFLARQVPQWLAQLASYESPGTLPGVEAITGWLERTRPPASPPGLMHGDFHLANLLYATASPHVAAIVDWEMCTIGDPLLDLGWLLATWPHERWHALGGAIGSAGGLPEPEALVTRYAERSGRDVQRADWYEVLACFKLAVVLEGTHARAHASQAPRPVGERLHAVALQLCDRARAVIEQGRVL